MVDYSLFKNFGCTSYTLTTKKRMIKLDTTFKKCCFLVYASGVKDYRLYYPVARKVVVSRDVFFNEIFLRGLVYGSTISF